MSDDAPKPRGRRWWLVALVPLGVCVLVLVVRFSSPRPLNLTRLLATPTSRVYEDCIWSGVAVAWIDTDGDSVHDAKEPPLSGVTFYVDDTINSLQRVGEGTSDWHGEAQVSVWLPGCPEARFEVYPDTVPGYRLTTEPRLDADAQVLDETFSFGFDYIEGAPTVTPRPPAPACVSHRPWGDRRIDLTDLYAAPDGTVWAASYSNGVARYLPERDEWVHYGVEEGLVSNRARRIAISEDNVVWIACIGGVSRFDGAEWTSYKAEEGLFARDVQAISIGKSGVVWIATREGALSLDPSIGAWKHYGVEEGLEDEDLGYVAEMPDGSTLFCSRREGISRLYSTEEASATAKWKHYGAYDRIDDVAVTTDGSYWFSARTRGIDRYDPETDIWEHYNIRSARAIEAAPDGSVWVAAGGEGTVVVYRLPPGVSADDPQVWETYDAEHDGIIAPEHLVEDDQPTALTIAPDGALWIGTKEAATRCVFPAQ